MPALSYILENHSTRRFERVLHGDAPIDVLIDHTVHELIMIVAGILNMGTGRSNLNYFSLSSMLSSRDYVQGKRAGSRRLSLYTTKL